MHPRASADNPFPSPSRSSSSFATTPFPLRLVGLEYCIVIERVNQAGERRKWAGQRHRRHRVIVLTRYIGAIYRQVRSLSPRIMAVLRSNRNAHLQPEIVVKGRMRRRPEEVESDRMKSVACSVQRTMCVSLSVIEWYANSWGTEESICDSIEWKRVT